MNVDIINKQYIFNVNIDSNGNQTVNADIVSRQLIVSVDVFKGGKGDKGDKGEDGADGQDGQDLTLSDFSVAPEAETLNDTDKFLIEQGGVWKVFSKQNLISVLPESSESVKGIIDLQTIKTLIDGSFFFSVPHLKMFSVNNDKWHQSYGTASFQDLTQSTGISDVNLLTPNVYSIIAYAPYNCKVDSIFILNNASTHQLNLAIYKADREGTIYGYKNPILIDSWASTSPHNPGGINVENINSSIIEKGKSIHLYVKTPTYSGTGAWGNLFIKFIKA